MCGFMCGFDNQIIAYAVRCYKNLYVAETTDRHRKTASQFLARLNQAPDMIFQV